jgi:hypothetical protein
MMEEHFKFRTELKIEKPPFSIGLKNKVLLAGSCFADVVGRFLTENKFTALVNPFGNIYNPHSLFKLLNDCIHGKKNEEQTFVQRENVWFNYNFHSEVFSESKEELEIKLDGIRNKVSEFLKQADVLILTFGTSYVYRRVENEEIVSNCHKMAGDHFKKYLLSPKEIIDDFEYLKNSLSNVRPDLKIILTISPVRHIKDTIPLNNVSKSILRTAVHYITESFPDTYYFPAYELMMDDLRDYRFYRDDLIHPTEMAEKYIWKKFSDAYLDTESSAFVKEWEKLRRAIQHKPFRQQSEQHQKFLKELKDKLLVLNHMVSLKTEIELVTSQITV